MVYESDFYTTRRPYSRPLVSSYSVTYRPIVIPLSSIIQLRSVPHLPYVAHKRLVTIVTSPVHHVYYAGAMVPIRVRARVRPSILAAELNRIRELPRPSTKSYIEEYLNSRDNIFFDDEAREIRARVDSLLRRVHVFVPRAVASDFAEEIVPERMRSHDYVRRLLTGRNNAKKEVEHLGWYEVPDRGAFGTLACVKYVAGRPQSVRKPYVKVADLRPADIRNDVNFLSYYSKNRQAAATASRALGIDSTAQEQKITPAPQLEEKSEKKSKKQVEPEPKKEPKPTREAEPEPVKEAEPIKEVEPVSELAKEPESVAEPQTKPIEELASVKPSKPMKGSKSAKPTKSAKAAEPKPEPTPEAKPIKEPEPVKEPEPEPVQESAKESVPVAEPEPETAAEPEAPAEPIAENAPIESAEAVSDEAKEEKVKKDKEDAIRKAEEYLAKAAREAQSEEERRKAAEEERLQLEMEERKAWEALQLAQERKAELCEILETERQEVERKAEEAKLQAEREETERIEEGERLINQEKLTALIQEQERLIIEEQLEEVQKQKQEQEEADTAQVPATEFNDINCAEDPVDPGEITDQEREEKPCDVTTDDETRIEEENVPEEEEHLEVTENPFVEEPEGAESKSQTGPLAVDEDEPQIEEITSGGEEFEWGDQDA
ncbi:uncharacterized protein [Anoplolepis gracilipes]|uniref:uncharacterized protein isoform X2 n=1 Tax=Anoplolepis gracilipes TaxID=354296 RepID=UPI003BA0392D